MIKKIITAVCCVAIVLSLTACGTDFGSKTYKAVEDNDLPYDNLIATNEKYTLELDDSNMGVILTDKSTGEKWSSSPIDEGGQQVDEFGMPIKRHPRVESILAVECKNFVSDEVNTYYSYTDAVNGGYVTHSPIENGIVLNFYFTEAGVMIPLECVLTENGVKLTVNPKKIQESDNRVVSLSIAPFFCGVKNDAEDSYLFVPSGSGALMDVSSKSDQGESFSAQVYGYDASIDEVALTAIKEPVRLGVYGVKSGDKAVCAIIDSSEGSAWIKANSGSKTTGYSSCYANFQLRGYTNHSAVVFTYYEVEKLVYSKMMIEKPVSVTYCPLSNENADYSGMAKVYRDYLIKNLGMKEASKNDATLNIRMIGGALMTKSFVGIPYKAVYPTTTLKDAEKIMAEIKKELNTDFSVQLKGFGESGVDVGKIAGSFNVSDKLGSLKELKKLFEYSKNNNIDLYFDFDIERFNKGSAGFTKFFDSITNAGEQKAVQYHYDLAVRHQKTETAFNLLSPVSFVKVYDKISAKTGKYNLLGISLDSASSTTYSDYIDKDNSTYYSKNGFASAVTDVIKAIKQEDKRFMASSANLYSAIMADVITEAPVTSEKNKAFLCDVPFYQMVFKGSVPITVQSINLAADSKLMLLKAIESGSGLGYTVIENWDVSLINAEYPYFYNSVFDSIKGDILNNSKQLSDYYKKISGQHIQKHTVYENGLRETVFENGVVVYVNYTDNAINTPAGEVLPYDYLITEKSL